MKNRNVKTTDLKLSELRPCDNCDGKIAPIFNVVEVKMAVFNTQSINSTLGLAQMFGGIQRPGAFALAECMSPGGDDAVSILEERDAITQLFLCQNCMCSHLNLAAVAEKRNNQLEKERERLAGKAQGA
jgi:hypothetical protein